MHSYRSDLRLYHLCLIQVSKDLWNQSAFKNHLVSNTDQYNINIETTIPGDLRRKIDELWLPQSVTDQLKLIVGLMGTRIRTWLRTVKQSRDNNTDLLGYIDRIHWTYLGSIDLNETIRSLYTCGTLPIGYCTWLDLSRSCVDDCIRDFWYKVSGLCPESSEGNLWQRLKSYLDVISEGIISERTAGNPRYADLFAELRSMKFSSYSIAYYWSQRMLNRLTKVEYEFDRTTKKYNSMNEKVFVLAFVDINYAVVNYFWKLLDNEQRRNVITEKCETILKILSHDVNIEEYVFRHKVQEVDLIAFLLDQMMFYGMNDENMQILRSKLTVIKLLMWPSERLFITTITDLIKNDKFIDYQLVLLKTLHFMRLHKVYVEKDSKCRELFYKIFEEQQDKVSPRIIKDLLIEAWIMKDIDVVKFILERQHSLEAKGAYFEALTAFSVLAQWYCDEDEAYHAFVEKYQGEVLVSSKDLQLFEDRHSIGQGKVHRILEWRY